MRANEKEMSDAFVCSSPFILSVRTRIWRLSFLDTCSCCLGLNVKLEKKILRPAQALARRETDLAPPPPEAPAVACASQGEAAHWTCDACTFENHETLPLCEICDAPRTAPVQAGKRSSPEAAPEPSHKRRGTSSDDIERPTCENDWAGRYCTFINPDMMKRICQMCEKSDS